MAAASSLVEAMEDWLASEDFDGAWRACYDRACHGSGRSDRNISESVFLRTAAAVHGRLPAGGGLAAMIPEPDAEFIHGALEHVCAESPKLAGFRDLEQFEAGLVVVYAQLAHCAETLRQQRPALAAIMTGVRPLT
mmetsp:Transcript_42905/g.121390  ORF Transcript_42905/g.121390 Transcript_42905/m.121390 type:complete len:136 (-) Transcript_42905:5-412(-)